MLVSLEGLLAKVLTGIQTDLGITQMSLTDLMAMHKPASVSSCVK